MGCEFYTAPAQELLGVQRGVGTHLALFQPAAVKHFFINLFVCEIFYTLVLCFTKFSILLFYWRIFKTNIRIPVIILATIVTGWGISVVSNGSSSLNHGDIDRKHIDYNHHLPMQSGSGFLGPYDSRELQSRCLRLLHRQCGSQHCHRLGLAHPTHPLHLAPAAKSRPKDCSLRRLFAGWLVRPPPLKPSF